MLSSKISVCFLIGLFGFLENFLYILDINPLLDMWFAGIFSQSIACLLTLFHKAKILNFEEVQFIHFSFYGLYFQCQV